MVSCLLLLKHIPSLHSSTIQKKLKTKGYFGKVNSIRINKDAQESLDWKISHPPFHYFHLCVVLSSLFLWGHPSVFPIWRIHLKPELTNHVRLGTRIAELWFNLAPLEERFQTFNFLSSSLFLLCLFLFVFRILFDKHEWRPHSVTKIICWRWLSLLWLTFPSLMVIHGKSCCRVMLLSVWSDGGGGKMV